MWVDNDVPTLKNFYRSPFWKWPPQYRTNSTLSDFNAISCGWIMMSRIDSWHGKISTGRHFQNGHHNTAQIQHCPISTTFHMWVDYDVPNWFLTSKNFFRSLFSKWPAQYRTNSTLFDFNILNWFPTSKNFYQSLFSKWPPQYRKNSTLFDFKGSF